MIDVELTWQEQDSLRKLLNERNKPKRRSKGIVCVETGDYYRNRQELCKALNVGKVTVSNYFNGIQKTLRGRTYKEGVR